MLLLTVLLAGCTRTSSVPPFTPTATPTAFSVDVFAGNQALPALIEAERTAARMRDLETLRQLWSSDARIIDSRGTPDPVDDFIWEGRDAILDRYRLAVFPNPPPPLAEPFDLQAIRSGYAAHAIAGNDRWRFLFENGRWWLQELMY